MEKEEGLKGQRGRRGLRGLRGQNRSPTFCLLVFLSFRLLDSKENLGQRDLVVFFQDVIVVLQSFLFHRVVRHADAFEEQFLFL